MGRMQESQWQYEKSLKEYVKSFAAEAEINPCSCQIHLFQPGE